MSESKHYLVSDGGWAFLVRKGLGMGEDISEWLGPRGGLGNGDLAQLRRGLVWEGERLVPGPAGQRGVPSPRVPVSF